MPLTPLTQAQSATYARHARLDDGVARLRAVKVLLTGVQKALRGVGLKDVKSTWEEPDFDPADYALDVPTPTAAWFDTDDLDADMHQGNPVDAALQNGSEALRLFRLSRHHVHTAEAIWGAVGWRVQPTLSWPAFRLAWQAYGDLCRIGLDQREFEALKKGAAEAPVHAAFTAEAANMTFHGLVPDQGADLTVHAVDAQSIGYPALPPKPNDTLFIRELVDPAAQPSAAVDGVLYSCLWFIQDLWNALDSVRAAARGSITSPEATSWMSANAGAKKPDPLVNWKTA